MKNLILFSAIMLATIAKLDAGTVVYPQLNKTSFAIFEKAELSFRINQTYTNPYDPAIVQVDAEVTVPNGSVQMVPCFYFVPATFQASTAEYWNATENTSQSQWKLRYSPASTGNYSVRIKITDAGGTTFSSTLTFQASAGANKGFVRIDTENKQFLRFDNQTPYYPIGHNLCWNSGTLTKFYNDWITNKLAPNKINWTRYWLTDFARQALEWKSGHWSGWYSGLGTYSQKAAGLLDEVIASHEANGIYMQLVLQHHGQFSSTVNPEWADNPYNTANGGFLANPGDFFTSPQAKQQTKKMYRYIVARWGYSQSILSWELFNEVEFTAGTDAAIDSWHDEMSQYLKSIDVNKHLVSTSSGSDDSTIPLMDDNASMDVLQWHTYSNQIEKKLYSNIQEFADLTKSSMNGEFGTGTEYPANGSHPDNWGDHIRKSMWISMMSASPSMFWFWDTYIEAKNLSSVFKPLATFLEDIDLAKTGNGVPKRPNFASAPSVASPVSVLPGKVGYWGDTNIPNPFTSAIGPDGNATNTAGLTNYIHGSWQSNRNRELSFSLNFTQTGTAALHVSGLSSSGTKIIEVYIDNALQRTWNITSAQIYTLNNIAPGNHTVRFYNSGLDWVEFSQIRFTGTAPTLSVEAYGYSGNERAYGYVNNLAYGDWAAPAGIATITNVSLEIEGLKAGIYHVKYFNPVSGATVSETDISYQANEIPSGRLAGKSHNLRTLAIEPLLLELPDFVKDIAYKVEFSGALPVRLIAFTGKPFENLIQLNWSTAEEINNKGFQIERGVDSKSFKTIGFVKGNDDNNVMKEFTFNDSDVLPGVVYYYRLFQQDFDGKSELSKMISVQMPGEAEVPLLYPNPNKGNFTISIPEGIESLKMFDTGGREIPVKISDTYRGKITISAKNDLPSGVYNLKIKSDKGVIKSLKVVVH